jgi:hypothetical protein
MQMRERRRGWQRLMLDLLHNYNLIDEMAWQSVNKLLSKQNHTSVEWTDGYTFVILFRQRASGWVSGLYLSCDKRVLANCEYLASSPVACGRASICSIRLFETSDLP